MSGNLPDSWRELSDDARKKAANESAAGWSYWKGNEEIFLTFEPSSDCLCIDCISWFEQRSS